MFGGSHHLHGSTYRTDALGCEVLERNLTHEAVEIDAIVCRSIAVCGQGVIGTAGIIAGTLASILSEEDAASIHHLVSQVRLVGSCNDEVFGGINIA